LSSSVSSAALLLSGSAGVTPTSVNPATKSSVVETMLVGRQKICCRSVRGPPNVR
jgi:hypothetical protein